MKNLCFFKWKKYNLYRAENSVWKPIKLLMTMNNQLEKFEIATFLCSQTSKHLMIWALFVFCIWLTWQIMLLTQTGPKIEKVTRENKIENFFSSNGTLSKNCWSFNVRALKLIHWNLLPGNNVHSTLNVMAWLLPLRKWWFIANAHGLGLEVCWQFTIRG